MKRNNLYKISVCILAVFMALSATSITSLAAVWTGGMSSVAPSRTNDGFYLLQSAEDLAWFASQVNSDAGNVTMKGRLLADIYLNDVENDDYSQKWTPIADYATTGRIFSGIFDGNGFTIYGMNVSSENYYQGLFGYLSGAQIRNVKIEKSYVSGINYVGGIAGYSDNRTSITSCSVDANISGAEDVGGITGRLSMNGNITYCYFIGKINATATRAGGLAGSTFSDSTISQSYNKGIVSSTGKYVGGIVGTNSGGMILSCYNTGDVTGKLRVGGISGNSAGEISSCYNSSSVVATDPDGLKGAIAGYQFASASKINNCYYNSSLYTEKEDAGVPLETDEMKRHSFVELLNGSIGDFYYDFLLANNGFPILAWQVDQNIWDGTMSEPEMSVEGDYYLITNPREFAWFAALVNGTLPGVAQNSSANAILENSMVLNAGNFGESSNIWTPIGADGVEYSGTFHGNGYTVRGMYITEGSMVGLFGKLSSDALVSNIIVAESYINGESSVGPVAGLSFGRIERAKVIYTEVSGSDYVGGIVGENWNEIADSSSIYSEITGTEYVGGIVGINNGGSTVSVCCSFNTVTGENYVGGVAGDNTADISNTFNVGSVTARDSYAGGIAGRSEGCVIKDCYNTGHITGDSKVGGIAGQLDFAEVTDSYSIGKVTGVYEANAVVGANYGGNVTSCYYDKNKVTDIEGNFVSDPDADGLRTTQMTNSDALDKMSGFEDSAWLASADSEYFYHYPQLMTFASSADYDLYDISLESVSYLKDGLICKVITNTENSYFKTLDEAFDKIGTGTGVVELMDKVTINSTATISGNVTIIPTVESNIILRNKSMFDKPIVVKDGGVLNFGADDASYATLTVDGNDVTDILGESFAESMVTVEKGGTFNFYDSIAVNHTGLIGGFINNSGTVNLYSGSITKCTAFQAGGVIYNKGDINVYATHFSENNSKLYGGVLFNAGGEVKVNTDTEITNNTAGEGGAIYVGGGTVNLLGGSLYSNTATSYGGAFYVYGNGKLKLYDGSIFENTAGINGAGIYTTGTVEFYASGSVDLSNDVYLPVGEKITMSALSVYSSPIVKITPAMYVEGFEVLTGGYTAMNANLCSVTPDGETIWQLNSGGRLTTSEIKTVLIASYFTADSVPYTSIEELFEDIDELEENLKNDENFNDQDIHEFPAIITLVDDITVNEPIVIRYNTFIISDGIAHTISAAEGFDGPMFKVVDGAVLTFGSSSDKYTSDVLYINGTNVTGDAIIDATDGSVKIHTGTVIFGANGLESAVKSANLIEMYGGKITENDVTVGAVYLADGTFNFFAGTIFDNENVGVYSNGTFNILDGAYVDETNIVYITDGHVINVISPEPEIDEETGEPIPLPDITMPEKIAHVDFEKYYVDTSIINTDKSDNAEKYAGKFTVADTIYTLDALNILRADNFVLKDNAEIKMRDNICVYGFTLDVYTENSLKLQFVNENIAVIDKDGSFKDGEVMVGTGDYVVLFDSKGTFYRTIPILIYGDINADGNVDAEDSLIVFMYLGGFFKEDEFTAAHLEAMDVNHDGQITEEDAEIIEKMGVYEGNIEQQMKW